MTRQEQFLADYFETFPGDVGVGTVIALPAGGVMLCSWLEDAHSIWLQQAKRHEEEKAGLVAALKLSRSKSDRLLYIKEAEVIDAVIAKHEVKS